MKMLKTLTLVAALNTIPEATYALTATVIKQNKLMALTTDLLSLTGGKDKVREILARAKEEASKRKALKGGTLLDHVTEILEEQRLKAMRGEL